MFESFNNLVFCFFFSTSCQAPATYEKEYESFYVDALQSGCPIDLVPIYFAKLDSYVAGYCVEGFGILINETHWGEYGEFQRLELIYHEMGHCLFDLRHYEPGLMAPVIHTEKEVKENWEQWKKEFFKKAC